MKGNRALIGGLVQTLTLDPNPHLNPDPHPNPNPHLYPDPDPNPNPNSEWEEAPTEPIHVLYKAHYTYVHLMLSWLLYGSKFCMFRGMAQKRRKNRKLHNNKKNSGRDMG